jgi:hypothetical protein
LTEPGNRQGAALRRPIDEPIGFAFMRDARK